MDPRHVFAHIFGIEAAIAATVFVLVCATVVVAIALSHRRKRRESEPSRATERTKTELAYAAAIAAVVAFVVALSFHATAEEHSGADPHAEQIRVTGFQWCWRFAYPKAHKSVTAGCEGDQVPTMVVPVGRPITLSITSDDVIHSWWVPALRYKLDAFPNHTNTVTLKIDKAGEWIGRCAEFCGHYHTFMDFFLKAVPAAQYRHWLSGTAA